MLAWVYRFNSLGLKAPENPARKLQLSCLHAAPLARQAAVP